MNWSHFLIVMRWQNVFILWLIQAVVYFRYVLFYCGHDQYSFTSFLLFIMASGCIAGTGNIYNDIRDVKTDALHADKPKLIGNEISISRAWRWSLWLIIISFVVVILGWWFFQWPILLLSLFAAGLSLVFLYSYFLKSTILTGNFLVALLCALSVWMTSLLASDCDLFMFVLPKSRISVILWGYFINVFAITLLREMVKDKEDAPADMAAGLKTIGSLRERSFRRILNGWILVTGMINGFWFYQLHPLMTSSNWNLGVFIVFIPLILITLIFNLPHKPNTYAFLSKLIKVFMLFGILLLILWQRG